METPASVSHTLWASTANLTRRQTRYRHPFLAYPANNTMNITDSILDLITERETVVAAAVTTLREQIRQLTDQLRTAESELNDLATTQTNLTRLAATQHPPPDNPPDTTIYQQILTVFTTGNNAAMRAKDVCHTLGIDTEPKTIERIRTKLKRMVKRRILTEPEPGLFTLTTRQPPAEQATTSTPNPT